MFGIVRRRTQGQLARAELKQGIGLLRQAATYAAKGAGATVGPRVQAARGAVAPTALVVRDRASSGLASTVAALAPLALAVRNAQAEATGKAVAGKKAAARQVTVSRKVKAKSMKAKRKQKRSRGTMVGLLAAGTVAGLAGAMALRRRREQQEWSEYDPARTVEPARDEVDTLVVETPSANPSTTRPDAQPVIHPTDRVPSVAEGARDVSGRPADNLDKALGKENAAGSGGRR